MNGKRSFVKGSAHSRISVSALHGQIELVVANPNRHHIPVVAHVHDGVSFGLSFDLPVM